MIVDIKYKASLFSNAPPWEALHEKINTTRCLEISEQFGCSSRVTPEQFLSKSGTAREQFQSSFHNVYFKRNCVFFLVFKLQILHQLTSKSSSTDWLHGSLFVHSLAWFNSFPRSWCFNESWFSSWCQLVSKSKQSFETDEEIHALMIDYCVASVVQFWEMQEDDISALHCVFDYPVVFQTEKQDSHAWENGKALNK